MKKCNFIAIFILIVIAIFLVEQKVKAIVAQDVYTINESGYIYDLLPDTTIDSFKEYMKLNEDDKIFLNKTIAENGIITTGMELQMSDDEKYTIVVKGDISGDGKLTITDIIQTKEAIVQIRETGDKEKLAVDIDENGKISSTDLMKLKRYQVGFDSPIINEKKVIINHENITIDLNSDVHTYNLVATVLPITAESTLIWQTSDSNIADVDQDGKVTAKEDGEATITVETNNGNTATCSVIVKTTENIKDFTISFENGYDDYVRNQENIYMFYENSSSKKWDDGRTMKPSSLQLVIIADNGSIPEDVTYSSSNTNVFTVSDTGLLSSTATPSYEKSTVVRGSDAKLTIKCGDIVKTYNVRVSCSSSVINVSCDNGGWVSGTLTNKSGTQHYQACITCHQCHRAHSPKSGSDVSQTRDENHQISCSLCGGWISLD